MGLKVAERVLLEKVRSLNSLNADRASGIVDISNLNDPAIKERVSKELIDRNVQIDDILKYLLEDKNEKQVNTGC